MTIKYICKFCNQQIEGTVALLGMHTAKHTNKLELPHKAVRYYNRIQENGQD